MALHALFNAFSTIAVQGLSILVLSPSDYGTFSLYYLVLGLSSSLCYSALSEAWSRTERLRGVRFSWEQYCTMLVAICLVSLLPVAVITIFVGGTWVSVLLGAAVALSTYRLGARYFSASTGNHRLVGRADITGGIAMLGSYFAFQTFLPNLESVSAAWCISSVLAVLLSKWPRFQKGYLPTHWIRDHLHAIRILLVDSVLLDIGSVGVPLVMAPMLGLANFGVYRSVSSAALPVRLLLNPLRPLIGRRPTKYFTKFRVVAPLFVGGAVLGGTVGVLLYVVGLQGWFAGSVIQDLASFAVPVGLFVALNLIGMFFYLVARSHVQGRSLFLYRVVQLAGAVTLPILGLVWGGLPGAIWGFVMNGLLLCIVAFALVVREPKARPGNGSTTPSIPN